MNLLSPKARRLLQVLTPERMPIGESVAYDLAVLELERFGLVSLEGFGDAKTIRLTPLGREQGNPAFNN